MTTTSTSNDAFTRMLAEIADSTIRVKRMADETHALVQRLEHQRAAAVTIPSGRSTTVERGK